MKSGGGMSFDPSDPSDPSIDVESLDATLASGVSSASHRRRFVATDAWAPAPSPPGGCPPWPPDVT